MRQVRSAFVCCIALMMAGVATAALTTFDDFPGTTLDTAKWTVTGMTAPDYQVTGGEFQFNGPGGGKGIQSKGTDLKLPDAIGEKLTVEVAWRKWNNVYFTHPRFRLHGYDLDADGDPDVDTKITMGSALPADDGGGTFYYRTSSPQDAANEVLSTFLAPTTQSGLGGDFNYDYFRIIYEGVDNGGALQLRFKFEARGDPQEASWRTLNVQTNYFPDRDIVQVWFEAGGHDMAAGYVKYECIDLIEWQTFDHFTGTELDSTVWTNLAEGSTGGMQYDVTGSEIRFDGDYEQIQSKGTVLRLPEFIGDRLSIEFGWRKWDNVHFTHPGVQPRGYDLDEAGEPDMDTKLYMGRVTVATTVYRIECINEANTVNSTFLAPTTQSGLGGDFNFDHFRWTYEAVDNGGSMQLNYKLEAKGWPEEPEWRVLNSQTDYPLIYNMDIIQMWIYPGNHDMAAGYLKYEWYRPPPQGMLVVIR